MRLSDHERAQGGTMTLSEAQFARLEELLTPGYELAKMYLAQAQASANTPPLVADSSPDPVVEPTDPEPVVTAPVKVVPPAPEPLS